MKEKDRLNALEVALNNEMRERAFYLKHAQRTKNPVGKAMFRQIADEELEHYERLKELHDKWKKEEMWPETVPLKVKETAVSSVLLDVVKAMDKTPLRPTVRLSMRNLEMRSPIHGRRLFSTFCQRLNMNIMSLSKKPRSI